MNRTNSKFFVKNLVLGALFLALALVLPFFTGHIPQIGAMLCPMHLPILLAGFVCGGPVGRGCGLYRPAAAYGDVRHAARSTSPSLWRLSC